MVLVPTMGALHAGHAALIRRARKLAGPDGFVAVSIFVNPTQFGPREDFGAYPRTWKADLRICRENGADGIFHPSVETMYHADRSIMVEESALSNVPLRRLAARSLSAASALLSRSSSISCSRPQPFFGEKDWQQLAIIRRMVRDLDFRVRIVGFPTVRESDGLAMSSRNSYLTRRSAPPRRASSVPCAKPRRLPRRRKS